MTPYLIITDEMTHALCLACLLYTSFHVINDFKYDCNKLSVIPEKLVGLLTAC